MHRRVTKVIRYSLFKALTDRMTLREYAACNVDSCVQMQQWSHALAVLCVTLITTYANADIICYSCEKCFNIRESHVSAVRTEGGCTIYIISSEGLHA